jgi:hypothetical protein
VFSGSFFFGFTIAHYFEYKSEKGRETLYFKLPACDLSIKNHKHLAPQSNTDFRKTRKKKGFYRFVEKNMRN